MTVKFKNPKGSIKQAVSYAEHLVASEGVAKVSKTLKNQSGVQEVVAPDEVVSNVLVPAKEAAVVTVGGKRTLNLGNYESASITIQLSLPCGKNEIGEVYDFATKWVSERMEKETSMVNKE